MEFSFGPLRSMSWIRSRYCLVSLREVSRPGRELRLHLRDRHLLELLVRRARRPRALGEDACDGRCGRRGRAELQEPPPVESGVGGRVRCVLPLLLLSLSLHREGLHEVCAGAVAGVDIDLARLDDELAAVVVEAVVVLVEREGDPLASRPGSASHARTRRRRTAGRCLPPGRGCRAGRRRRPCGPPVFVTLTEALRLPF